LVRVCQSPYGEMSDTQQLILYRTVAIHGSVTVLLLSPAVITRKNRLKCINGHIQVNTIM